MKKTLSFIVLILVVISCKDSSKNGTNNSELTISEVFNDSSYVLNANYPIGDVRRYGVFPDSIHPSGHPFTKTTRLETILNLSEDHDIEMIFPKGYYNKTLVIKGRKGIKLNFKNAEFGGMVQIFEQDSVMSSNINFKGNLITYGGFFTRNSNSINIEDITIKSNPDKNLNKLRSKGCNIYAGSRNIKINNLIVEDLGSGSDAYKYVNSALSIEGWNNNPKNVQIGKVHIKSTDRHGVYITGTDHLIGEVIIDKFGIGSAEGMSPMQDAVKGEEVEFKALWINKCYNSSIESVTINEKDSKAKYTAHFDSGDKTQPFIIGQLNILNDNPGISILEDESHGIIIESQQ